MQRDPLVVNGEQVLSPGRSLRFIIRCLGKFLSTEDTELLEVVYREVIQSLDRKRFCAEARGAAHEALISSLATLCHAHSS